MKVLHALIALPLTILLLVIGIGGLATLYDAAMATPESLTRRAEWRRTSDRDMCASRAGMRRNVPAYVSAAMKEDPHLVATYVLCMSELGYGGDVNPMPRLP